MESLNFMEGASDNTSQFSRRRFLGWIIAAVGAVIAAILGGSGIGYFISPAFKRKEENWVDLGPIGTFPKGNPTKVEFVQRIRDAWVTTERRSSAWVLTSDGENFIIFDPRCTHLGCPYHWDEEKKQFLCPCHTAIFDAAGGVMAGPPPRPLDRYQNKIVSDHLYVLPKPTQVKI